MTDFELVNYYESRSDYHIGSTFRDPAPVRPQKPRRGVFVFWTIVILTLAASVALVGLERLQ